MRLEPQNAFPEKVFPTSEAASFNSKISALTSQEKFFWNFVTKPTGPFCSTAVLHFGLIACYYCISLQLTTSTYGLSRNAENTRRCQSCKNWVIQLLSVSSSLWQLYIGIGCSFLYLIFLIVCQFFLAFYQNLRCWCKSAHSCKCSFFIWCALLRIFHDSY